MQHHTGEHLLSGLAHRLFGAENVGFHLGEDDVTMDLDLPLDRYALDQIEMLANEAVWKNLPVMATYPEPETLSSLSYRSKLDLKENVRIVTIKDYDDCACCAPHVAMTGEIGMIKILNYMNYKGGVRLHIVCGKDALEDYRSRYASILEISNLLSVKQGEVVAGVKQLQNALIDAKRAENALRNRILDEAIKSLPVDPTPENLLVFVPLLEARQLREFVNCGVTRTGGIFAAFSGSDDDGYSFILGAKSTDLRPFVKEMNLALNGRGGGSKEMVQGAVKTSEEAIRAFFAEKQ
jgi:alanyl-tRNA synthetase